ncbi:MAG: hypothetical protein KKG99_10635 [Bacteroidetes bacterium]|nr:hypothetical protein [Bacteroidota bacterium]
MDDNSKLIVALLEKATDYGKTSYELGKLKAFEILADIGSSILPQSIAIGIIALFMLFFNLGIAFWLGELLGKTYLGFAAVAAFYGFSGIIFRVFLHKWIKERNNNYIIKMLHK